MDMRFETWDVWSLSVRFTENSSKWISKVNVWFCGSTRGHMGQGWQWTSRHIFRTKADIVLCTSSFSVV